MIINSRHLTSKEKDLVKKELSVYIKSDYSPTKRYLAYIKKQDSYTLPFYWAQQNLAEKVNTCWTCTKRNFPETDIELRPIQKECVEKILLELQKDCGGGVINLSTGSGKTIISLYIISKVKYKTLVVVNKIELMNQWKQAIDKIFNGQVSVGVIQGNIFQKDCDISIAMLQTISQKYTRNDFLEFSLVFIDEVHNTPSEVFNKALHKVRNKYTFGLSATIDRKDGMEKIIHWHIGPILYSDSSSSKKQDTIFEKINYNGKSSKEVQMYNGKINISQMLNNLANDTTRTRIICDKIKSLLEDSRRKVLVLSDRTQLLKDMAEILGNSSGMFIGKTPQEEKTVSKGKRVVLATYSIASEGFNLPELNTLVLATPRSNVKQSIGRIYRQKHDISPMIVDVVDNMGIFMCQYKKRRKIYSDEINAEKLADDLENVCLFE